MKEYIGNKKSIITNGCSNHSKRDREENDFYATDPRAVECLLELEEFGDLILEPCCGNGHISEVLKNNGKLVISRDLIDRGYGKGNEDFLLSTEKDLALDIITNPPYKYALLRGFERRRGR